MLIDGANGMPNFDATLWVASALRGKGSASATIEQALRSLIVLYKALKSQKIDLADRLHNEMLLNPAECDFIINACKIKSSVIDSQTIENENVNVKGNENRITSLEKYRADIKSFNRNSFVDASTTAIRLGYIRAFLLWRTNQQIFRLSKDKRGSLITLSELVDAELKNRTPSVKSRATLKSRIGIEIQSQAILRNITMPDHPQNPWKNEYIKVRNQLIVNGLLSLGIRRGEMLGIRMGDLKPQMQEIHILRRPDDNDDTRLDEPNTKTRDRALPLPHDLYRIMKLYIPLRHSLVQGSHGYLLAANNGNPLSKSGLKRVFDDLNKIPELSNVHPHILRHSFFENLANDLYKSGIGDVEILHYLRQQGGWSDSSHTPHRYIKRFTQERANKAILSMQDKLFINSPGGINEKSN